MVAFLHSGRKQLLEMRYYVSRDILVTSDVPQDSHLGPLHFIWFVNEIAQIFEYVRVLFYADNMKLFLHERGFQEYLKILGDLNRLVDWRGANSLELNVGKFESITCWGVLSLIVLTLSLIWRLC
jgi:hypothetical protein